MNGGLFGEDAQQGFLKERTHGDPLSDSATRRLNVSLPRSREAPTVSAAESAVDDFEVEKVTDGDAERGGSEPSVSEPGGREQQQDVVIRLSEPVVRALLAARDERGMTTTDVVLDAVDRAWPELEKVAPPMQERSSPLPVRTRRRRVGGSRGKRVHLRLTPSERATLEDLVDCTTAGSLTDLIERVLRHRFGDTGGRCEGL